MKYLDFTPKDRDKLVVDLGKVRTAIEDGHRLESMQLLDKIITDVKTLQLAEVGNEPSEPQSEKEPSEEGSEEPEDSRPQSGRESEDEPASTGGIVGMPTGGGQEE